MPSLVQDIGAGYGLVHTNTTSIVALGNAGGGGGPTNGLLQEDGASYILTEASDYLVQE